MTIPAIPTELKATFRLYISELPSYLGFIGEILGTEELTDDEINSVHKKFHQLKGSAGFFGIEEIVALSRSIELAFSTPGISKNARKALLRDAQTKLEAHLEELTYWH